ncbi:OmpA family protein [Galbibacter pacificus]|uniref:OmpA family protein n=1 Tax=Galbibacter pacificus TaxID=2996052 RepID=A0ABT6FQV8_9FLAO|nr:OmpA family protein [Galbibacter pacificus]MDG3581876.1 OmpA family protein [Galbibacter pacificus]MDG3585650.1 OmpA family protein [Galbibacter pacificus]
MAQTDDERNTDKNFDRFWYKRAAQQYESAVKKGDTSKETLQRLGDAYYFNLDMENAAKWYGELFSKYENELEPIYAFRYIQSLEGTGDYHLAKGLMKIYSEKLNDSTFNVDQLKNNDKLIDALRNTQPQFYITPLSINTPVSDFGAIRYGNHVVFASARDSSVFTSRKYHWNEQPFLNLFIADTTSNGGDLKNVHSFSKSINSKYHEASVAFTKGFDTIYFTRNNYTNSKLKRDAQGANNLKIYRAVLRNNNWKDITELPFSSDEYSVGHPSLSPDGKKLYFTSDMPGTIGGSDIYVVDILSEGNFSEPRNLGENINTSGREMFPFITDKKLYFASEGHLGYGGLDVFEATVTEEGFSKPKNLGLPLNSQLDDFAYMVDENTQRGYVSSNRPGGVGDDDIYSFQRSDEKCMQSIEGTVVNSDTKYPEPNVTVKLYDGEKVLDSTLTSNVGEYRFDMPVNCGHTYNVIAAKESFDTAEKSVETSLEPNFVNEVPLEINHKLIVREGDDLKIKIGLIYFDFDKWNITPRAIESLDTIVNVMKEYPGMVIKIESHTDSRGNDAYNMQLSDKRAKSTRDYILSRGIEPERIESAIGYGESRLLNECANNVPCTEAQHDVNRRSEFIIVKMK